MAIQEDQVGGKNSAKFHPMFKYSLTGTLYNIILTCIIIGLDIIGIPNTYHMKYHGRTTVNRATDTAQAILGFITTLIVLLTYCTHQKDAVQVGNKIHEIRQALGDFCDRYNRGAVMKPLLSVWSLNVLLWLIIGYYGCSITDDQIAFLTLYLTNIIPIWLIIQYDFVVRFIFNMFEAINVELRRTRKIPVLCHQENVVVSSAEKASNVRLSSLRVLYLSLCDVSDDVCKYYSFTVLACVSYIFTALIFLIYFIIAPFILGHSEVTSGYLISCSAWMAVYSFPIYMLTRSVTLVIDEVHNCIMIF